MEFGPITDVADPRLRRVGEIYLQAIPASERKPLDWLMSTQERPEYRLLCAMEQREPIALAVVYVDGPGEWSLLEYLAVDEHCRGRGVGGRLFEHVLAAGPGWPLIVEVDSVGDEASCVNARRRQAFYRRMGCRRVGGLRYQLPLERVPPPPPMDLFLAHAPAVLSRDRLGRWLSGVYTGVYGVSTDDPRLAEMLAPLPARILLD